MNGHFYFRLVLSLVTLSGWMGGVVEADPVWHRPVGPSQPFRAGDSPTPKGGKLSCVTGGGEGVAGPSSMLSTLGQIDVNTTCLSACTWTVSCATRIALHLPPVPARQNSCCTAGSRPPSAAIVTTRFSLSKSRRAPRTQSSPRQL